MDTVHRRVVLRIRITAQGFQACLAQGRSPAVRYDCTVCTIRQHPTFLEVAPAPQFTLRSGRLAGQSVELLRVGPGSLGCSVEVDATRLPVSRDEISPLPPMPQQIPHLAAG